MDFNLSEEQETFKKAARDFLAERLSKAEVRKMEESDTGYSPEIWKEMAGLGWMGMVFPEKYGGRGKGFLHLAVLLEEMGRACLPGPYFSTVVLGGFSIMDAASEKQKQEYLPKIAGGEIILTLALTEANAKYKATSVKVRASSERDEFTINGTKLFVADAHIADYLICVVRTGDEVKAADGISLFIVDTTKPGINTTVLKTVANDKLCEVTFNQTKVPRENVLGEVGLAWNNVEKIVERAALAKCCEMLGGLQAVFDMTIDYAKNRVQFGRPIGSFQIIQHYCANMAIDIDCSRLSIYKAAWLMSEGLPCTKEIAIAKSWTSQAYRRTIALAHQIHGAIGLSLDYDLHFYTRRARAAETSFGDIDFYQEILAGEMNF
ncbi:acyl-CoA dehydrogenase family protein [Chloroflexota bacterium]